MSYVVYGVIEAPQTYPSHFNFNLEPSIETDDKAIKAAELLTSPKLLRWPVKRLVISCDGRVILRRQFKKKK